MPRLDHPQLPVRDWRRSRDWYRDHLGFAKVYWGYGAELLDPDGHRVLLWYPKSMKEKGV